MKKLLLSVAAVVAGGTALAVSIPQPPVVIYGLVRDEYGSPLTSDDNATLRLSKDGDGVVVYDKTVVGETALLGVNYRLQLEIDSEGPSRQYAVVSGTPMRISCARGGKDVNMIPSPVFAAPPCGTAQRSDYFLGEDADGDGLPDAWEEWVLDCAGRPSDAAAIAAFKPGDDPDRDGMSNYQEFLAYTDPFIGTDLESVEITLFARLDDSSVVEIKFTTATGHNYSIVYSPSLETPSWSPLATAREKDGTFIPGKYAGTGGEITVYAQIPVGTRAFFKVAME